MPRTIEKVLATGGMGETGHDLTPRLYEDYTDVIATTRPRDLRRPESDQKRVSVFQDEIALKTGKRPRVLVTNLEDIINRESASAFVDSLELKDGEEIDFVALAAGGLPTSTVGKEFVRSKEPLEKGSLTQKDIDLSTAEIRRKVEGDPEIIRKAMRINTYSPTLILMELVSRRHITENSLVVALSSSLSDDFELNKPDLIFPENDVNAPDISVIGLPDIDEFTTGIFPKFYGPKFYGPTARSKRGFAVNAKALSEMYGFKFLDVVAPEIRDTKVGEYFEGFAERVNFVRRDNPDWTPARMPFVTREMTSRVVIEQMRRLKLSDENYLKVYVTESGEASDERPEDWTKEPLRGCY